MDGHIAYLLERRNKMPEKRDSVGGFIIEKIVHNTIIAGMNLVLI
jgi:hypothetical protein